MALRREHDRNRKSRRGTIRHPPEGGRPLEPSAPLSTNPVRTSNSDQNRGRRAREGSGVVAGSGAAAGGSDIEEDYDGDPIGGGGRNQMPVERHPGQGTLPAELNRSSADAAAGRAP